MFCDMHLAFLIAMIIAARRSVQLHTFGSLSSSSSPLLLAYSTRSVIRTTMATTTSCSMTNNNQPTQNKNCVPCEGLDASAVLSIEEVSKRLETTLPLWKLTPVSGDAGDSTGNDSKSTKNMISKSFVAKSFQAALDALNDMGAIAESQGHHPDFHLTSYRNVQIDVFTHSLQGITENDLTLAELLDQVPIQYSPKWLKEHPQAVVVGPAEAT